MVKLDQDKAEPSTTEKVGRIGAASVPYATLAITLIAQVKQIGLAWTIGGLAVGAVAVVVVVVSVKRGWRVAGTIALAILLLGTVFVVGRLTAPLEETNKPAPVSGNASPQLELNATILSYTPQGVTQAVPLNVPPSGTPAVTPEIDVNGAFANINDSHDIWAVITPENDKLFRIQRGPCRIDLQQSKFFCTDVRVGNEGDKGKILRWQIFVVRTTKGRSEEWRRRVADDSVLIHSLPEDVIRLDAKSVIRQ